MRGGSKSWRQSAHVVAVAVPNFERRRRASEQLRTIWSARTIHAQMSAAILAPLGLFDFPAERVCDPLHAIADSKDGNAQRQHLRVTPRRIVVINRAGAAGQDDSRGLELLNLLDGRGARQNRGENLLLADAARNQLRVLPAEVQHHHAAEFRPHPASVLAFRNLLCRAFCHGASGANHEEKSTGLTSARSLSQKKTRHYKTRAVTPQLG